MKIDDIRNEGNFQAWVLNRFRAITYRSHFTDLSAVGGGVPDFNATVAGEEYWLELKYGEFRVLHSRYDDFKWATLKLAQVDWLRRRQKAGARHCFILGFAWVIGDHSRAPYLIAHDPRDYANRENQNFGGVLLSDAAAPAHSVKTGPDLLDFLWQARSGAPRQRPVAT